MPTFHATFESLDTSEYLYNRVLIYLIVKTNFTVAAFNVSSFSFSNYFFLRLRFF